MLGEPKNSRKELIPSSFHDLSVEEHRMKAVDLERINLEWRATLDALSELVVLVSGSGKILRVNRTAESWGLGSVRELPGKPFHAALHPACEDPDCYLLRHWEELRDPPEREAPAAGKAASEHGFEDWHLGRRITLKVRRIGSNAAAGENEESFAVLVLNDITVRYRRNESHSRRQKLESLGHLVRGLAHEISNPLAAIKTSAQVLFRSFDHFSREKKETYLRRIVDETDRVQTILDRLLREQDWKIGPLVAVPVGELFTGLAEVFADEMVERRLEFVVVRPAEPDLALEGDREAVDLVLAIVLENAMDACAAGDRVIVTCHSDPEQLRIQVHDTGSGMSQGELERVFQPFFSTKAQGSGLGMSHADHLLKQMRGRLDIESAEGEGTKVNLVFRPWPAAGPARGEDG